MQSMLRKLFIALALMASSSLSGVTIQVQTGLLRDENGTPIVNPGLVLLIASTTNNDFSYIDDPNMGIGPGNIQVGSFLNGPGGGSDDLIIASGMTTPPGPFQGYALFETGSISFESLSPDWDTGDQLGMLWFPNLTAGNNFASEGDFYGFYTTPLIPPPNGLDPWFTPGPTAAVLVQFLTTDANPAIFGPGNSAPSMANAPHEVVPEPAAYALLFGAGSLGLVLFRRRRKN